MENSEAVKDQVTRLIAEVIEQPLAKLDLDARFVEDLGVDSLLALEILAVLEKKFQIEIPEDDLVYFVNTRQIIGMLEGKLQAAQAACA